MGCGQTQQIDRGMRRLHRHLLNALKWEYSLALMLPIAKWTHTPLTHTHMHTQPPCTRIPHPHTRTVSQSSLCEYMNTVNCSDRVNYSVRFQATKHQKCFMASCVCVNMEIRRLGLAQPGSGYDTFPGAAVIVVYFSYVFN